MWFLQGFDGDTSLGDVVRAAMFSKSFPDIKSPQQMAFEMNVESIINDEEIDLEELSAAEFVTDSESEEDNENVYQILEDIDFLGEVPKKKRREDPATKSGKNETGEASTSRQDAVPKDEQYTSSETRQPGEQEKMAQEKKQSLKDALGEMTDEDKKALGVLFLSIKQMRKAAKLNPSALTRIQNLIIEYPSLKFLYKLLKPVTEIMPEQPINTIVPVVNLPGLVPTSGGTKYPTQEKTELKLMPKKYLMSGKVMFCCSAEDCDFTRPSWGAVNTHIVSVHTNKVYMCQMCKKTLNCWMVIAVTCKSSITLQSKKQCISTF